MKEKLIELETALLAQEKGFDIETYQMPYMLDGEYRGRRGGAVDCKNYVKCCTQTLLQKWLREVHGIDIVMGISYNSKTHKKTYTADPVVLDVSFIKIPKQNSYEEALEVGLQEALKLIYV